jgi:hypothetical protein
MLAKIDLRKELKHLYNPPKKEAVIVDVPPMSFLMIDGSGDPNTSPAFRAAMEALYSMSYTLKFAVKKRLGIDYTVMALEGLWWSGDLAAFDFALDKNRWQWTMMMMQPEMVTAALVEEARAEVEKKRNPPALAKLRFAPFHEGLSAQIMHVGPYSDEKPTIEKLHRFIRDSGYELAGKHHEIYLGDPNRSAPEKLKTVIRQPMRKQAP